MDESSEYKYIPGDTSVDTSEQHIQDSATLTENVETEQVFGKLGYDVQAAVGVPVDREYYENEPKRSPSRFESMKDVADERYRYPTDPDAPPDAAGPQPVLGTIGSFVVEDSIANPEVAAATEAASHLTNRSNTVEMLDAMEQAEAAFGDGGSGSGGGGPEREQQQQLHKQGISDMLRSKVKDKLAEALSMNPNFAGDVSVGAAKLEMAIFQNGHSTATVYQSVASNAIRVTAGSTGNLEEILRVATGQPRGG